MSVHVFHMYLVLPLMLSFLILLSLYKVVPFMGILISSQVSHVTYAKKKLNYIIFNSSLTYFSTIYLFVLNKDDNSIIISVKNIDKLNSNFRKFIMSVEIYHDLKLSTIKKHGEGC